MADSLSALGSTTLWKITPNMREVPEAKLGYARKIIAFGGTVQQFLTLTTRRQHSINLLITMKDKQEEYDLLQKFATLKGRLSRVWLPSPQRFFSLKGNHSIGDNYLLCHLNYFDYQGHERIYLAENENYITRQITSVTKDENLQEMRLYLNSNLDRNLTPQDVYYFSFLYLCRLENDGLDIKQYSKTVSEVNLSFIELPGEYSEA